jgi:phosphate transport system regulatory protein phoU
MVKFIDDHLNNIKEKVSKMWSLVYEQIEKSHTAVLKMDDTLAKQILTGEKRVNAFELEIDSDIEDFIALYTPVAIDLRFALAMLNINNNLERIGDYAEGIARFILRCEDCKIDKKLLDELKIDEMFRLVLEMLALTHNALLEEDSNRAKGVFAKDDRIDELNTDSLRILSDYAGNHPESARMCIELSGVFRKLERAGDHINNLAEETIFYIDANILKHHKKPM